MAERRMLILTTPYMRGADVEHAQRELHRHGFDAGNFDGVYGPATERAVVRFQHAHRLEVDGVVGPRTLAALDRLESGQHPRPPHRDRGHAGDPIGTRAVAWMAARLGEHETPDGSNRCPVTAEFGLVGPWCCMTVSLAFKHAEGYVLGSDVSPPPAGFWPARGFAYVPSLEAWARHVGFWIGRSAPQAGDVVCFILPEPNRPPVTEPNHVGMVTGRSSSGGIDTIEGNAGNAIRRETHGMADVAGFIRVRRK